MNTRNLLVLVGGILLMMIAGCIRTEPVASPQNAAETPSQGDEAHVLHPVDIAAASPYLIIAHRGASAYLPEHTLASKVMAYAMGADYIEQDIAITKDDRAIVIHDHYLDTVTNVAEVFPDRKRDDGRYYVVDFTLEEIKQLRAFERIDLESGEAVYPGRFPTDAAVPFEIPTLEEEIELIQGLNKSTGRNVGIYPELKAPWFHTQEGKEIGPIVLGILEDYGYTDRDAKCYVQCFDPDYLRSLREDLGTRLKLVQLIADNSWNETPDVDYDTMLTPEGLDEIAEYAEGVGPWMNFIVVDNGEGNEPEFTDFVQLAHKRGLAVHPYTFRADSLPSYASDLEELFEIFLLDLGVDGVFTDFPDRGVTFIATHPELH